MITEIKKVDDNSIQLAKNILIKGGVVAFPTETVYGLGAIGTDENAVKKIFEVKGRPTDNPLIAHVHKDYDLTKLVYIDHNYVYDLVKAFVPGPLTLVFRSKGVVCSLAVCGGETLAVRIPVHSDAQALLKAIDKPIVAPSANVSKHVSPVTAEHVYNDLNGKISLILDGGKCDGGIESTVLDVTDKVPRILRAGLITKEMIEGVVGCCEIAKHLETDKVKSPGVKYKHYRPKCETVLFYENQLDLVEERYIEEEQKGNNPYILCSNEYANRFKDKNLLLLGNNAEEIASNLYYKLLEGEKKAGIIIAIGFNRQDGVYLGIMNRLTKSCS